VISLSTSSPFSDLPTKAPRAMAIGSPVIPVPGIPTPIAFFSTLGLKKTSIESGLLSSTSVALAVHSETAMGSVHPTAGIISCCMIALIRDRSSIGSILMVRFGSYKREITKKVDSLLLPFNDLRVKAWAVMFSPSNADSIRGLA